MLSPSPIYKNYFIFYFTTWYKSICLLYVVLTTSRLKKCHLFWATTTLEVSRPEMPAGGQLWAANLDWIYYRKWLKFNLPSTFPLTIRWNENFSFLIKMEDVIVPALFLQNGGCNVTQVSFFQKSEKVPLANRCPNSNHGWLWNPSSRLGARASTDRHTETDTQKGPLRYNINIFSHPEMTKYKQWNTK